jgi:hypothetical protein
VWVVTGLVSAKSFSVTSVSLCSDTDGSYMFETVLSEGYEVMNTFNVSHTQKRVVFVTESTLVLRLTVRSCRCFH